MNPAKPARPRRRLRGGAVAVLMLLLATVLAGCVSLPTSGQVRSGPSEEQPSEDAPFDFNPGGPKRGATPIDIVNGFLLAMQATPLRTDVARQFLTTESSGTWAPEKGTVIHGGSAVTAEGSVVQLQLTDVVRLDGRGEWLGDPTGGKGLRYRLHLVREKGQWRISDPPDALVIPRSHFDSRFAQYYLYFFDESAQVLVPEPVYLPRGDQTPTLLVRGLLRGVDKRLVGTERTFIPAHTQLDLSVPVGEDGSAEVPLSGEVLDLSRHDLELAAAQLAWTLQQVPGVERMRITVDGSPVDLPGQGPDAAVDTWSEYDPAVNWASQELFGLRGGHVVTVVDGEQRRVAGPFGERALGVRSIAVTMTGQRIAGVTTDGSSILTGTRVPAGAKGASQPGPSVVYSGGTDLLPPAWDIYGRLWVLDRTSAGASLSVVTSGKVTPLQVPGVTGQDVKAFILSRDGTRLVAVLHHHGGDEVVIARVRRDHSGRVRGFSEARPLPLGASQVTEVRDVAWRTAGSVALLTGPGPGVSQVIVARVDGSSALDDMAANAELLRDDAVNIVTSPASGAPLYVGTAGGKLLELALTGRWTGAGIPPGLMSPTFVG